MAGVGRLQVREEPAGERAVAGEPEAVLDGRTVMTGSFNFTRQAEDNNAENLLILRDLVCGLARYEDFRRSSGVTNATLSDRLKHLEANGLIERRRYQVSPERFEYFLTDKGRQIAPVMLMLSQIGDRWQVSGASAPPLKFVNLKTGGDVAWCFVDQNTGERLSAQDLGIQEGPGADDLVRWRLSHAAHRRDGRLVARPGRAQA